MRSIAKSTAASFAAIAAALVTSLGVTAAPATAASTGAQYDTACNVTYSYIEAGAHHGAGEVNYCRLWGGSIGVRSAPGSSTLVGTVNSANSNWFRGDTLASRFCSGAYCNNAWAFTEADNGAWGWVPEVYFSSSNTTWDPNLRSCDGNPGLCAPF
ncbi:MULTISPECIES: hypothetical protein [unclassified Streptomyces]|uniref:hypothetical protein n=1 Tax=unclassified Streptomyces TaxID=2593676 RepID=UPI0036E7D9FA